jgi:hypothetical protein
MGADHYLEAAKRFGVCPIGTPEADQDRVALDYRITEWTQYPTGWLQEYTGIVDAALAKDQPVVIAFGINTYAVNNPDWTLALMSPTDGAHSVCLLRSTPSAPYDFENSWGAGWGRGGFGTIARDMLIKWRSGTSGIYSCRVARPVSIPVTPQGNAVTFDDTLAALKQPWTQAQRDAFIAILQPGVAPPSTPPSTSPAADLVIGARVTAPDGAVFALDGAAVNRNGARVGVPGRYATAIARDSAGAIKAQVQTVGPGREWLLYPAWTPTSAPV